MLAETDTKYPCKFGGAEEAFQGKRGGVSWDTPSRDAACNLRFRCSKDTDFSLQLVWLLSAFCSDPNAPPRKRSQGVQLKHLILSEDLRYVLEVTPTT